MWECILLVIRLESEYKLKLLRCGRRRNKSLILASARRSFIVFHEVIYMRCIDAHLFRSISINYRHQFINPRHYLKSPPGPPVLLVKIRLTLAMVKMQVFFFWQGCEAVQTLLILNVYINLNSHLSFWLSLYINGKDLQLWHGTYIR